MAMDPAALLATVETAISDIVTGKRSSYTLPDGTSVTSHDLSKLFAMRKELIAEVAAAAAGDTTGIGAGFEQVEFRRD